MNLRPPGPQPGALPDCATPRSVLSIVGAGASRMQSGGLKKRPKPVGMCFACRAQTTRLGLGDAAAAEKQSPLEQFAWRCKARRQRDNYCGPCRAGYKREHYAANRSRYIERALAPEQTPIPERAAYIVDFFRGHPCVDCGEDDPIVLEFDHRADKCFEISKGLRDREWQSVLDEIAKCDVVCANCHRRRTARRGRFARAAVAQR